MGLKETVNLQHIHNKSFDVTVAKEEVYKEWAKDYDGHVSSMKYAGPSVVAKKLLSHFSGSDESRVKILDAACGTGLLGKEIVNLTKDDTAREWCLHGCDISEDMMEIASPYYETLRRVDMNASLSQYPADEFGAITCVGAFLEGHVFPNPALKEFLRITKVGGVVLMTVRETFFESHFKLALEDVHKVADIVVEDIAYLAGVNAKLVTLTKKSPQKKSTNHHIAMLGLGRMGSSMAKLFLAQDYNVYLYDKYADSLAYTTKEEMKQLGGVWKDTVQNAVQNADFVITNLPLPEHVYDVMAGAGNGIVAMKSGSVWADFSTTDYHKTVKLAELCKCNNILPLEIPVSNLHQLGVDIGNASFYAAGSREGYAKVVEDMDVISAKTFFVSTEIGKAQTIKLLTNLMFYAATAISGEALTVCKHAGIPAHYAWLFLKDGTSMSMEMRHFVPCLLDGSYDRSCTLEVVVKDMNLTMDLDDEFRANGSKYSACRVLPATLKLFNRAASAYKDTELAHLPHMLVNKVTETDTGISLQEDNWVSPSPHGMDKTYKHSTYYSDSLGRKQPVIPDKYLSSDFCPSAEQQVILDTMREWVTYTNFLAYLDAEALGLGMGIDPHQFIEWSVGGCWVSDNLHLYTSDLCKETVRNLQNVRETIADLKLVVSLEILNNVEAMAVKDQSLLAPVCDIDRLINPEPVYLNTLMFRKLKEGDSLEIARMMKALKTHGIAFLDGFMDFPEDVCEACMSFFQLPFETKNLYNSDVQSVFPANARGFVGMGGETLNTLEGPDKKELFDLGLKGQMQPEDPAGSPFIGPTTMPDDVTPQFSAALHKIQRMVMEEVVPVVSSCLDFSFENPTENQMRTLMNEPTLIQRTIHYPPHSDSFAGCHTDNGMFTLLFFNGDPPQMLIDGEWRQVYNSPGTPILFAGDLLEHWSDGEIISKQHRVRCSGSTKSRISLPFFIYPNINSSVANIRNGEVLSTKEFMLKNFEGIWEKGEGAGLSKTYRDSI